MKIFDDYLNYSSWKQNQVFLDKNLIFEKDKNNFENKYQKPLFEMIDSHLHYTDFLGRTEGIKSLLNYMNENNIKKTVLFGCPVKKIWSDNEISMPEYYLDDDNYCYYDSFSDTLIANAILSLSKKEQERFYPLVCWFNPMDINSITYLENIFKLYPWIFCWLWEIFYRHDDLTSQTIGEPPRMNTVATEKIIEFAGKYNLPILVHNNMTSPTVKDYPKYLKEFEETLFKFPRTKIILAHCGASRRLNIPNYIDLIDRLLREYDNLYLDYSWVIFDEVIMANETSFNEWIEITEKYNKKIMIWSDLLWLSFHKIWIENSKFNKFLLHLSEKTRENICINNSENLFKSNKKNNLF